MRLEEDLEDKSFEDTSAELIGHSHMKEQSVSEVTAMDLQMMHTQTITDNDNYQTNPACFGSNEGHSKQRSSILSKERNSINHNCRNAPRLNTLSANGGLNDIEVDLELQRQTSDVLAPNQVRYRQRLSNIPSDDASPQSPLFPLHRDDDKVPFAQTMNSPTKANRVKQS